MAADRVPEEAMQQEEGPLVPRTKRNGERTSWRERTAERMVGVRTLIMGCQTITLIVYSPLTPSVCLDVYSRRNQRIWLPPPLAALSWR